MPEQRRPHRLRSSSTATMIHCKSHCGHEWPKSERRGRLKSKSGKAVKSGADVPEKDYPVTVFVKGITASDLARCRLTSKKKELDDARNNLQSRARECNAEMWALVCKPMEDYVRQVEADKVKCESIVNQIHELESVSKVAKSAPARGHFHATAGTASVLAAAFLPVEGREERSEQRRRVAAANPSCFPEEFRNTLLDMNMKDKSDGCSLKRESSRAALAAAKDRVLASGGQAGLQKIPHTTASVQQTTLLTKVRNRKKALATDKTYKPQTEPAILSACKELMKDKPLKTECPNSLERRPRSCQAGSRKHPVSTPW